MAFLSLSSLPQNSFALQSRGNSVQRPSCVRDCPRASNFSRRLEALCPPHKAPGIARRCLVTQSGWQPDNQDPEPEKQSSRSQEAADGLSGKDSEGQHVVNQSQWQEEHRDQHNNPANDLHKHNSLAGSQAAGLQTSSSNASCSSSSTEQPVGNDDSAYATSQQKEDPSLLMLGQAAESSNVIPPQKRGPPRRPIPRSSPRFSQQNQTRVDGSNSSSSSSSSSSRMDPQQTLPNHDTSGSSNLLSRESIAQASAALVANDSTQSAAQHQQPAHSSSIGTEPLAGKHNSVDASSLQTEGLGGPMPSQAANSDNILLATCSGSNSNVQQQMPASNSTGGSSTPDSMVAARVSPTPQMLPTLLMRSSRLVELMQRVSEDRLTKLKKDLGPVQEAGTKEDCLPLVVYIGIPSYEDSLMFDSPKEMLMCCRHKLPVTRWKRTKKPNIGGIFYRCAHDIRVTRHCFYAVPNRFKPELWLEAAERSAEMWEDPSPEDSNAEKKLAVRSYWEKARRESAKALPPDVPHEEQNGEQDKAQSEKEMHHWQRAGAWGESYLYLWLKEVLPGFEERNWVSSNRRFLLKNLDRQHMWQIEPPFDFEYKDVEGVLGVKGARYFVDAKATRGVAVPVARGPHDILVTAREWDKAKEIHENHRAQGDEAYVIIALDRVDDDYLDSGCPRLAAVLVDPYGMAHDPVT